MNYNLNQNTVNSSLSASLRDFGPLIVGDRIKLVIAVIAVLINSSATIFTPYLISLALDNYISKNDLSGLNILLLGLVALYLMSAVLSYFQTRLVGRISQRVLFRMRESLFKHIQNFPISFFSANKAGDIITRVNSDTDKINNFMTGSIFQFVSSFFSFTGIGIFIFFLNWKMAIVVWLAVFLVVGVSQGLGSFIQNKNAQSLRANSDVTAFLDENFNNFKALVVFNKGEYMRETFATLNNDAYNKAIWAQALNGFFNPFYNFAGNVAQILVLAFGLYLLSTGNLTAGLLVGFITYTQKFYEPLRALGNVWGTLQEALAAWARVRGILQMK